MLSCWFHLSDTFPISYDFQKYCSLLYIAISVVSDGIVIAMSIMIIASILIALDSAPPEGPRKSGEVL